MYANAEDKARKLESKNEKLVAKNKKMTSALTKIIEWNRQAAHDQYGDAEKAERYACVIEAREALK